MLITLTPVASIPPETPAFSTPGRHPAWRNGGETLACLWDNSVGPPPNGDKAINRSQSNKHLSRIGTWPASEIAASTAPPTLLTFAASELRMMALYMLTYLPSNILIKLDRDAVGALLKTCVPFLDH